MPVSAIITKGLGTLYGSPSLMVTHGFLPGSAVIPVPLQTFQARQRQYLFLAGGLRGMLTFPKDPEEDYPIAVEFALQLPSNTSISTCILSAIDTESGDDATADVLEDTDGLVQGTQVVLVPMAGEDEHDYIVKLALTLLPTGDLVERLRMQVRDGL